MTQPLWETCCSDWLSSLGRISSLCLIRIFLLHLWLLPLIRYCVCLRRVWLCFVYNSPLINKGSNEISWSLPPPGWENSIFQSFLIGHMTQIPGHFSGPLLKSMQFTKTEDTKLDTVILTSFECWAIGIATGAAIHAINSTAQDVAVIPHKCSGCSHSTGD